MPSYGAVSQVGDGRLAPHVRESQEHAHLSSRKEVHDHGISVDIDREHGVDRGMCHALRHPWVWMILFTAFAMSASSALLRPLLAERVMRDLHRSVMFTAMLFSLWAVVRLFSESLSIALLPRCIGVRATGVVGFVFTVFAFHVLGKAEMTSLGFLIVAYGTGMGVVVTVTDLATTTRTDVDGVAHSLSLLASFTFGLGDVMGLVIGGYLFKARGSFEDVVQSWTGFLTVGCGIVTAPYVLGKLMQWCGMWRSGVDTEQRGDV